MTKSRTVEVNVTQSTLVGQTAQATADSAASGVANLNDPNLMSVIEKQTQAAQYAGLTSQYNVVLARANTANVSTTALTTAYTNLNTFMSAILTDTTTASDVDRASYQSLTAAYNTVLSSVQTTLGDYVNNEFSAAGSQTVVAASNASDAKSAADNALSQANTAIDNDAATSQAVTDLKDGSKLTIAELEDDILLRVTKDGLVDEINLQAGNTLISSSGQLTLSGKTIYFDTTNPVIIPSANLDTVLVNKTLTAADISANTFTTNNGTFTVAADGAITAKNMVLTGGTLSALTVDAATINGSSIYGTDFYAGDISTDANNTNKVYPFHISDDGTATATAFNTMDAMQSAMIPGGLTLKYRAISSSGTQYEAYDVTLDADQLVLNSGYTTGKDTTFSQSVSGTQLTGQVLISPLNGLTLHGDTQMIYFNGMSTDTTPKGIAFTPYGNLNATGTQGTWYLGHDNSLQTANFGIDSAGSNPIKFSRNTTIGNLFLGIGHTIAMVDGSPLYFNKTDSTGGRVGIYAGAVNYTSLVKSSLLSVKKDVQKADTAYWAQLVNSIDLATYQYKTDDNTSHLRLSSIVDDVNVTKQWQLPDVFINRDENGKLSGVDDSVLLNATLATVQEQQKEIDQLNGHNMELEARLNKLEAKLNG
ncbi:hypothetical protein [Lactiplantibacillus fabifermentans]|uniref:Tail fiber n=1 Tax=Lactiplantibacillus fabifermentans DSM 21115 TaxID=1413187 RepID=A0A0R2NS20_9LACO|nr:hypothetical protein [Lactiplantibacillus fabifermentans]KRO28472.1 tail fiber [Lactiplantibacillus fabifermentans DSM 21115]